VSWKKKFSELSTKFVFTKENEGTLKVLKIGEVENPKWRGQYKRHKERK